MHLEMSPLRAQSSGGPAVPTPLAVILALTVAAIVGLPLNAQAASPVSWSPTTDFPIASGNLHCVTSDGYIYCVGGSSSYYAPLSSTGIGAWAQTTSYPISVSAESCVASIGYVYCVSGCCDSKQPTAPTTQAYYASLSSSGIGAWAQTTAIPTGEISMSCAVASGHIFCVGGEQTVGSLANGVDYYASISSSGIGAWAATTNYPTDIYDETCVTSGNYIYCIGGLNATNNETSAVYYAAVSSSGVRDWSQTTGYPIATAGTRCVVSASGYVGCVGASYYSHASSVGLGPWTQTSSYPGFGLLSCVISGSHVYCVDSNQTTYFAPISSAGNHHHLF